MVKKNTEKKVDIKLLSAMLLLLACGLFFLHSASAVFSFRRFGTDTYFFTHQLLNGALLGSLALFICSKIDYHKWQRFAPFFILLSIVLLVVVLIPGVGLDVKGAKRWLVLGPLNMQPAEFAKIALIIYLASWIDKRNEEMKDFYYGLVPCLLVIVIITGLVILEPDLGTMLSMGAIAASMLFLGGARLKHLGYLFVSAVAALLVMIKLEPYRLARITTYLNPDYDPTGIGYQINQAMLAIGSAGLFGYGFGQSRQKHNFLPEVMGDSVFAVITEELGFLRVCLILGLFLYIAFRGLTIAQNAPDTFGKMLASGISAWFIFQAFINIAAIIGLLPLTGIPLPLISYGSSAMIVTLAAFGMLLNVSKHSSAQG